MYFTGSDGKRKPKRQTVSAQENGTEKVWMNAEDAEAQRKSLFIRNYSG